MFCIFILFLYLCTVACSLTMLDLIEFDYSKYEKIGLWMKEIKSIPQWPKVHDDFEKVAAEMREKCKL